jgi:hypothetical protein
MGDTRLRIDIMRTATAAYRRCAPGTPVGTRVCVRSFWVNLDEWPTMPKGELVVVADPYSDAPRVLGRIPLPKEGQ